MAKVMRTLRSLSPWQNVAPSPISVRSNPRELAWTCGSASLSKREVFTKGRTLGELVGESGLDAPRKQEIENPIPRIVRVWGVDQFGRRRERCFPSRWLGRFRLRGVRGATPTFRTCRAGEPALSRALLS